MILAVWTGPVVLSLIISTCALMGAAISIVSGLRTAERRALGMLTAPARLFNPGEPLALMPMNFLSF